MITCEFCHKKYKNKYILKTHQKSTKKCLAIQSNIGAIPMKKTFVCNGCNKSMYSKDCLYKHNKICIPHIERCIEEKYKKKYISLFREKEEKYISLDGSQYHQQGGNTQWMRLNIVIEKD